MLATGTLVTVTVAVASFAATDTVAGTVATAVLLLVNVTIAPPLGAGPLSVTVPTDEVPPVTLAGFSVTEATPGGVTVIVTVAVSDITPPTFA